MELGTACEQCGAPVVQPVTGRRRRYCGDPCKRAAFRVRQAEESTDPVAVPDSPGDDTVAVDLALLSDDELRTLAGRLNLSTDGDRDALIERIEAECAPGDETKAVDLSTLSDEELGTLAELEAFEDTPAPPPSGPVHRKWMHPTEPHTRPKKRRDNRRVITPKPRPRGIW